MFYKLYDNDYDDDERRCLKITTIISSYLFAGSSTILSAVWDVLIAQLTHVFLQTQ